MDLDGLVQLRMEVEPAEPSGVPITPQSVAEALCRPGYVPESNLFVLENIHGNVVGYVDVFPELDIGRVVLSGLVHPAYRGRGMAKALFHCAMRRISELGGANTHVAVAEDDDAAIALLRSLGFCSVRRYLELGTVLDNLSSLNGERCECVLRCPYPGEEADLVEVQNACFSGSWGFAPNTVREITHRLEQPGRSLKDVVIAYDDNKPVAYCWTERYQRHSVIKVPKTGRIHMLGVDPAYRGKGLGHTVLLAGLHMLKRKGISIVELTVDSENHVALGLYLSMGFTRRSANLWFEKYIHE
ncbi:MAG: GNAT family N-acetyltransferase [Chloroflexota bacterium]|nr:GNAT family N-acetyltransferase [Chloroflexota bacterium]